MRETSPEVLEVCAFPRVLVVGSTPFNAQFNNGQTITSLFNGWPTDSVRQVFFSSISPVRRDISVCAQQWQITRLSSLIDSVKAKRRVLPSVLQESRHEFAGSTPKMRKSPFTTLFRTLYKSPLGRWALDTWYSAPGVYSHELRKWILEFRPSVIYLMVDCCYVMRLACKISRDFDIPLVPHVTDDWLGVPEMAAGVRGRSRRLWGLVLKRSVVRLAISEPMAQEYTSRYGGQWEVFAKPFERVGEGSPMRQSHGIKHLLYMGGLHLGRCETLRSVAAAVASEGGILEVRAPERDVELYGMGLESAGALLKPFVQSEDVTRVLQEADAICVVESFVPSVLRYTRLSFSTKLAEALAAGVPILAVCPEGHLVLKLLGEQGVVHAVHTLNESELVAAVRKLLFDEQFRDEQVARSLTFAASRFQAKDVRRRFAVSMSRGSHWAVPKIQQ